MNNANRGKSPANRANRQPIAVTLHPVTLTAAATPPRSAPTRRETPTAHNQTACPALVRSDTWRRSPSVLGVLAQLLESFRDLRPGLGVLGFVQHLLLEVFRLRRVCELADPLHEFCH